MKKLLFLFISSIFLSSCISLHSGFPTSSVALSLPNFTYIKTNVLGQSSVTYFLGMGGYNGALVNTAMIDLKKKHKLKDHQAYANLTVNFKKSIMLGGLFITSTCEINADIVEFQKLNSKNKKNKEKIIVNENSQPISEENSQPISEENLEKLEKRKNELKKLLKFKAISQEEYDNTIRKLDQIKQ